MASEYCTATESCAAILEHDDDWLIVGQGVTDVYAASFGGNVAADEAAVVVPKAVMDAHVQPLLDRIAELEAGRERAARTAGRLEYHADAQRARAERAEAELAALKPEFTFRWTEFGIEETSLTYGSYEDAAEARRPHHRDAPIVTRLAGEWRLVDEAATNYEIKEA